MIDKISVAPDVLTQQAILIDEARGEAEQLSKMYISEYFGTVVLKWVIPIYPSEADFILKEGIDKFDDLDNACKWNLVETQRPPLV